MTAGGDTMDWYLLELPTKVPEDCYKRLLPVERAY